jgi:hypothetical protein
MRLSGVLFFFAYAVQSAIDARLDVVEGEWTKLLS